MDASVSDTARQSLVSLADVKHWRIKPDLSGLLYCMKQQPCTGQLADIKDVLPVQDDFSEHYNTPGEKLVTTVGECLYSELSAAAVEAEGLRSRLSARVRHLLRREQSTYTPGKAASEAVSKIIDSHSLKAEQMDSL